MNDKTTNKTVLIAMTGGLESVVSAYLLKKQGYRCIGIGFQLFEANVDPGPFSEVVISDLNRVKTICSYLDIPFYAVDASEEFSYSVVDPVVGRILSGQTYEPLVFLNLVLIELLIKKAAKFNTKLIATGHYAKVLKNQKSGSFELIVANDLEHDQSYLLSRLDQQHLENLILPLSEIRKKEVEKIGELIKVDFQKRSKHSIHQIMRDPRMINFVESRSSRDLRRVGSVFDYREAGAICEHQGIHHFYVGQKNAITKIENQIDPQKEVISIVPFKGNVFIDYSNRLKYTHALICKFVPAAHLDTTLPLLVYVKMSPTVAKIPCRLYFKNNDTCVVDFENERSGLLVAGQLFVFYSRELDKGKVLGSGIVEVGGVFKKEGFNTLPINRRDVDEEDEDGTKYKKIHDEKLHF